MQIARSKQEKIEKLTVHYFSDEAVDIASPMSNKSIDGKKKPKAKKMDLEVAAQDSGKNLAGGKKKCAGCDFEIQKNDKQDDYYSECQECASYFCSDCDLLIVDSLRFCPICQD
jgi:hypothetical protein